MGQLNGSVALITGAARGQGRSHAVRLSQEGAAIIAVDIADQIDTVNYPMARPKDLEETAEIVKSNGGRILIRQADVRDQGALDAVVSKGFTNSDL